MAERVQKPPAMGRLPQVLTLLIVVTVVGGIAAAAIGGSWSDLGSGYGGLYGLPAIAMTVMSLLVIPVAVLVARRLGPDAGGLRSAVLLAAGLWVVTLGYSQVAHLVDPCANGWWDHRSRIGSQPLCERFGSELNWHTRFHLLAHAGPAAVLLVLYLYAIKRWGHTDTSETPHA